MGISASRRSIKIGRAASMMSVKIGRIAARIFSIKGRIFASSLLRICITAAMSSAIIGSTEPSISKMGSSMSPINSTS